MTATPRIAEGPGKAEALHTVLAIGAHPDDIELGCGGSITKLTAAGVHVRALIMSQGRRGLMSDEDRAIETRDALGLLGVTDVAVYDFADTQLWRFVIEMVEVIETHVRELAPQRVYTMFQHDRHQDPRTVYEASSIACREVPQLLGYETPSCYPHFMPTVFEQIGTQLETKSRRSSATRARAPGSTCRKKRSAPPPCSAAPRSVPAPPRASSPTSSYSEVIP